MFLLSNPHSEAIVGFVPEVIIPENCRLHNKIYMVLIFSTSELPQYIVVPPNDSEMKDMICISQSASNDQNFKLDSLF